MRDQLLGYADDVILLGDNINTITENTKALTDASKEVSLEAETEKNNIVAHLLTAKTVKPAETAVAGKRLRKYASC
jgi:hypothetical protein